jgi:hypothetical protein
MLEAVVIIDLTGVAAGSVCTPYPDFIFSSSCYKVNGGKYVPGERIFDDRECLGTIVNGFCRGLGENQSCANHTQCDIGLICVSGSCIPAKDEGQACSSSNLLCKSYLTCVNGVCQKYGTIPNGQASTSGDLCQSGYVRNGVCTKGQKLLGKIYVNDNQDRCYYDDGTQLYADCHYQKDGKALCPLGMGDLEGEWKTMLNYLHKNPECNPKVSPYSTCDYAETQVGREYLKAFIAYWKVKRFGDVEDLVDCMKKHSFPAYFRALERLNGAASISVLFGLLLTTLLFI